LYIAHLFIFILTVLILGFICKNTRRLGGR